MARRPKPSQTLDADAQRLLAALLAELDLAEVAAFAGESESTVRRYAGGGTGARASVRALTQAVLVLVCQRLPALAAGERATLERLNAGCTPGGVGLAISPPP